MADGNLSELEKRLDREREALAQSIDRLGDTLSPSRLSTEARETAETWGRTVGRQVWDATRENPAAFSLVGAGIALLLSGTGRRDELDGIRPERSAPPTRSVVADPDPAISYPPAPPMPSRQPHRASASRMRATLHSGMSRLPPEAQRRVLRARRAAIEAQDAVERHASRVSYQARKLVNGKPIPVAAVAFGIGALAAALLPGTRREDELLGERRDVLVAEARNLLRHESEALGERARAAMKNVDAET